MHLVARTDHKISREEWEAVALLAAELAASNESLHKPDVAREVDNHFPAWSLMLRETARNACFDAYCLFCKAEVNETFAASETDPAEKRESLVAADAFRSQALWAVLRFWADGVVPGNAAWGTVFITDKEERVNRGIVAPVEGIQSSGGWDDRRKW